MGRAEHERLDAVVSALEDKPLVILDGTRNHVGKFHPVARRDTVDNHAKRIAALETRITRLECAARGHSRTKTVIEPGNEQRVRYVGVDLATRKQTDKLGTVGRAGTWTTITCLDCGATISDNWEPKEDEDDSDK